MFKGVTGKEKNYFFVNLRLHAQLKRGEIMKNFWKREGVTITGLL
jgi:hypothetical protein